MKNGEKRVQYKLVCEGKDSRDGWEQEFISESDLRGALRWVDFKQAKRITIISLD